MAKLIVSEKVIKEITNISPIIGHEIVVYKKNGDKITLLEHLHENQPFQEARKSLLERLLRTEMDSYIGYAVDMNPYLESIHSDLFKADDFNSFDLTYAIEYQVIDVTRLVSKVIEAGEDALMRLRTIVAKEIKELLLKHLTVIYIADNELFKSYAQNISEIDAQSKVPAEVFELYRIINQKVADVGLQVNKINVSRQLTAREVEEERKRLEAERIQQGKLEQQKREEELRRNAREFDKKRGLDEVTYKDEIAWLKQQQEIKDANHAEEIKRLRKESEVNNLLYDAKLDDYKRNSQLKQAMIEAAEKALMNVGNNVSTAADLRKAADEIRRLIIDQQVEPSNGNQNQLSSAGGKLLLPELSNKSLNELIKIFSQVVEILNNSSVQSDQTRSIMSKVLYFLGELMLGDKADDARLNEYFEQIRQQFVAVSAELRLERTTQLRDLFNLEELKIRFR